ncbi:MAG TPA: TOBE domain-containing protein [Actinomycetes bacterium]|nr:TOBE domain-containing protein [Actinomycetes bacterium]
MKLSARNQLSGTVTNVELGAVMAEVTVDVDGPQIVSAITRASASPTASLSPCSSRQPRSCSASTTPDGRRRHPQHRRAGP